MKNLLGWIFTMAVYLASGQTATRWVPTFIQKAEFKDGGEWKLTLARPGDVTLQDSLGFVVGSNATG